MWHKAAYNHTHSHTETREKQLYYNYALADDKTLVSAMPADESHDLSKIYNNNNSFCIDFDLEL